MCARIQSSLVVALLAVCSLALSGEPSTVAVTVKSDGHSCVVRHVEFNCGSLASVLLNDLGVGLSNAVSVSPEGCGESALAQAHAVAVTLKKAGFNQIFVVGFLTEPNTKCAA